MPNAWRLREFLPERRTTEEELSMKRAARVVSLLSVVALASVQSVVGALPYQEAKGLVVIEAENTSSGLGKWVKRSSVEGYTGKGYLEFTGNRPLSGKPNSPVEYTFQINKGGLYYLHLHCARETVVIDGKKRHDVANDGFVRVEGDYGPGPNPGDKHGKDAPLKMLKKDTKFYGGKDNEFAWASGNRLDPGGHNNKRVAVYKFKPGKTYTLVLSGRSQLFKVNRIIFRHESVKPNVAHDLSIRESSKRR